MKTGIQKYKNKDWLKQKYYGEKMTLSEIGKICNRSEGCISNWMEEFNLKRRSMSEAINLRYKKEEDKYPYRNKEWLINEYINKKRSTTNIGKEFDLAHANIRYWLNKYEIPIRTPGEGIHLANGNFLDEFPYQLHKFLDGSLLGDGYLSSGKRWSSSFKQQSKFKSYIAWVKRTFEDFDLKSTNIRMYTKDQTHNRLFSTTYAFNTKNYADFRAERDRWYPDGIKRVPTDLTFSPLLVKKWYLDDGSLRSNQSQVILCTNCFARSGLDILLNQFQEIDISPVLYETKKDSGQWMMAINKSYIDTFFDYIGRYPPVRDMAYKFHR